VICSSHIELEAYLGKFRNVLLHLHTDKLGRDARHKERFRRIFHPPVWRRPRSSRSHLELETRQKDTLASELDTRKGNCSGNESVTKYESKISNL
jgi:hypothetical protein